MMSSSSSGSRRVLLPLQLLTKCTMLFLMIRSSTFSVLSRNDDDGNWLGRNPEEQKPSKRLASPRPFVRSSSERASDKNEVQILPSCTSCLVVRFIYRVAMKCAKGHVLSA